MNTFGHRNHSLEINKKKTLGKKNWLNFLTKSIQLTFLRRLFMLIEQHLSGSKRKKLENKTQTRKHGNFYDRLQYLKEEIEKFDIEERELLIDFYKSCPSLWNHNTTEYHDRNLRDSLLDELVDEFENKFKKEEIKQGWHSLETSNKRENSREEGSKSSGVDYLLLYLRTLQPDVFSRCYHKC